MINHRKAGKIALSVLLAATVSVGTGSMLVAQADTSAISDFTLPSITGPYNINACFGTNATKLNFNWFSQSSNKATGTTSQLQYTPAGNYTNGAWPTTGVTTVNATQKTVTATENISTNAPGFVLPGTNGKSDGYGDGVINGAAPQNKATGEYENLATATGLAANTQYAYRVSDGTNWSPVYTISTAPTDSIQFAAFGDPQMGAYDNASKTKPSNATNGHQNIVDDGNGWANMLNVVSQNKGLNFLLSLGDQINDYNYLGENVSGDTMGGGQWDQYLTYFGIKPANNNGGTYGTYSNVMQSYPLVAFSGNHDHQMGEYYGYHYNHPNQSQLGGTQYGNDGDYWFTAGPVLFFVLNANNYATADHDEFMADALSAAKAEGLNTKWKVAVWHQSAYSEGNHDSQNNATDPVLTIRNTWPAMMQKYGVDAVFQGHDHYYTRTAQMQDGIALDPNNNYAAEPASWLTPTTSVNIPQAATQTSGSSNAAPATTNPNATYAAKAYPTSVTNPQGIVYFTLDSGSGSKYYNYDGISSTEQTTNLPTDHSFSVVGWQGYLPSYSLVTATGTSLSVNTYALKSTTDTNIADQQQIDTYTINKTSANGGSTTTSAATTGTAATGTSATGASAAGVSTASVGNPHTGVDAQGNLASSALSIGAIAALLGGATLVVLRKKKV